MPVNWTAENDRKLLLNLITTLSTKDINAEALASLFPGATPKAILERVAKLRRELKAANGATGTNTKAATTKPATSTASTVAATTKPTKPTTTTPVIIKAAATSTTATAKTTTACRKRNREIEEGDAVEDVAVKKRGRGRGRGVEGAGEEGVDILVKDEGRGDDKDGGIGVNVWG